MISFFNHEISIDSTNKDNLVNAPIVKSDMQEITDELMYILSDEEFNKICSEGFGPEMKFTIAAEKFLEVFSSANFQKYEDLSKFICFINTQDDLAKMKINISIEPIDFTGREFYFF